MGASELSPRRLAVAVRVASAGWRAPPFAPACAGARAAVRASFAAADRAARGSVSICLSDDAHMRTLNRLWRGKDQATNVLAFAAPREMQERLGLWGDILLAEETVLREAQAQGRAPHAHLAQLVIHGMLHLLGYAHDTRARAHRMQQLERQAWQRCRQQGAPALGGAS